MVGRLGFCGFFRFGGEKDWAGRRGGVGLDRWGVFQCVTGTWGPLDVGLTCTPRNFWAHKLFFSFTFRGGWASWAFFSFPVGAESSTGSKSLHAAKRIRNQLLWVGPAYACLPAQKIWEQSLQFLAARVLVCPISLRPSPAGRQCRGEEIVSGGDQPVCPFPRSASNWLQLLVPACGQAIAGYAVASAGDR
jgi:hypothetical protein